MQSSSRESRPCWLVWLLAALLLIAIPAAYRLSHLWFGLRGVLWFSNLAPIVGALAAVVILAVRVTAYRDQDLWFWRLLLLAFSGWLAAEVLWTYYELWLGIEIPYPSPADTVWLLAYLPLLAALWMRLESIRFHLPPSRLIGLLIVLLPTIGFLFLMIVVPILTAPAGERPLEKIYSLLYPIMDLIVLSLVLLMAYFYRSGLHAGTWLLILSGMILMVLVDLLFVYATWHGLYDSSLPLSPAVFLVDGFYPLFYVLVALGVLHEIRRVKEEQSPVRRTA